MPDGLAKVVIVGAGFGGIEAVKSLSRSTVEVSAGDVALPTTALRRKGPALLAPLLNR